MIEVRCKSKFHLDHPISKKDVDCYAMHVRDHFVNFACGRAGEVWKEDLSILLELTQGIE